MGTTSKGGTIKMMQLKHGGNMPPKKTKPLLTIAIFLFVFFLLLSCSQLDLEADPTALVSGSTECISPTTGKVKVIILSGQSNAAGVTPVSDISPEERELYATGFCNALIRSSTDTIHTDIFVPVTSSLGYDKGFFGPELGMAESLSEQYKDETIYIIKYARCGHNLYNDFYPSNNSYKELVEWIDQSLNLLTQQGLEYEIIAFAWMQGESDAINYSTACQYYENEKYFINFLRQRYGTVSLSGGFFFLDAGITTNWKYYTIINNAKYKLSNDLPRCVFINANANNLLCQPNDKAHLDAPSMLKLGQLFAMRVEFHLRE